MKFYKDYWFYFRVRSKKKSMIRHFNDSEVESLESGLELLFERCEQNYRNSKSENDKDQQMEILMKYLKLKNSIFHSDYEFCALSNIKFDGLSLIIMIMVIESSSSYFLFENIKKIIYLFINNDNNEEQKKINFLHEIHIIFQRIIFTYFQNFDFVKTIFKAVLINYRFKYFGKIYYFNQYDQNLDQEIYQNPDDITLSIKDKITLWYKL